MNASFWLISCLVINYSTAKPFSLNEALAAELDQKQITETSSSQLPEKTAERFSLNKVLKPKPKSNILFKESGNILSRVKKLSPLKYRKKFEIKTPLKPKNLKRLPKSKLKRKNQSIKREINGNDQLNQKYIPLLKNIGMLFDNLLMSDESDSYEIRSRKYKRNKYTFSSAERNEMECTCAHRPNIEQAKSLSAEKTIAVSTPSTEISIDSEDLTFATTTTETTDNTTVSDFGGVRLYQNVPLLFPRDTVSGGRNNNGISERSSSAYNWSIEGNFTWNHGNSEYSSEFGQNESLTQNDDEITCHDSRNCTSGNGSLERRRRNGSHSRSPNTRFTAEEASVTEESKNFSEHKIYRPDSQYKRQNNLDMGGDQTKSAKSLSELIRRLRGFISEIQVNASSDIVQSKKNYKESILDVAHSNSSHKRFSDRSSSNTKEIEKIGPRNETMIFSKTSLNSDTIKQSDKAPPVLMIIDGYSVTRHKNGENKLSKKAIHIHSSDSQ